VRQEFVAPFYTPSPQADDEDATWQDEEPLPPPPSRFQSLRQMTAFVIAMMAIGAVSALAWEYSGLRAASAGLAWPAFASVPAVPVAGKPQPEEQLAGIARELGDLKKSVGELTKAMQQLAASNGALQAGQQELRQRISTLPASSHWYSDTAALRLRFATPQPKPPAPAARAAQETTASVRRSESAPLTLRAP
jgi:hypothetical protein